MSRADNIRRAKETIASYRSESIAEYERRTAEISKKSKRFSDIDKELSKTGVKLMGFSLGKSGDFTNIEDIKKNYNDLVTERRNILLANVYPADYCDIKYHCEKCSDTGYIGIEICSCLKKEIAKVSLENSGLFSLAKSQTFETFCLDYFEKDDIILMRRNLDILKAFVENFVPGKSDSFLFMGGTGLGKTHLSSATAQKIIEKGSYVVYESSLKFFSDFEEKRFGNNGFFGNNSSDIEKYNECDLLIIDDLGCELTNQFTLACLYNIINTRMIEHKSTIISTNLSQNELRNRYTDRIISRIFCEFKPLIFRGSDIREQKIRRNLATKNKLK